ncbi:hypothetical protein [Ruminococcus bicirculans (ex Wegman et al. 2014)]|uniref:hypothetical protein n=1 Tax=Ruminococcus bicirculans (ex Wegman et al. 2014) TaxID=1160721 RepID=UPI00366F72D0
MAKRIFERFKKLNKKKKIQLVTAAVLTMALLVALPLYAWFTHTRSIAMTTQINAPTQLYITAGNKESVANLEMGNIDVESGTYKDITYTLTVTLVDSSGNEIGDGDFDKYSVIFDGVTKRFSADSKSISYQDRVLSTGGFSYDDFILNFDKSQLTSSNVFMKLEAVPTDPSDLPTLSAIIGVSYVKPYSASWTGQFTDNTPQPSDLDGFNYRLSGSGEGTVTLTWNTNYVDISPWFKNTYGLTILKDSSGIATATLKVNSAEKNQYDIQFYRTNGINSAEQWSDGNHTDITVTGTGFVSMSFTQSTATEN